MVVKAVGYYGTGLTPGNSLSDKTILNGAGVKSRPFSDVALKQTRSLVYAKIAATWTQINDIDYLVIGEDCYWVTGIVMLNENVAQLTLAYDAITSVGISNIDIISGWCTRRCVVNDDIFSNTIQESFVPTEEMVIDFGSRLAPNNKKGQSNFVILTCGLFEPAETILGGTFYKPGEDVLTEVGEFLGVVVPEIPELNDFTSFSMDMGSVFELVNETVSSPMSALFNLDSLKVHYTLAKLNALGLNNAIIYAYSIPDCYIDSITYLGGDEPVQIAHIHSKQTNIQSELPVKFGNYKNNKVYSGQYMKYTILSMASGDGNTFPVEEIVSNEEGVSHEVFYTICADLQYIGYPFIFPMRYHGSFNKNMIGAVNGAEWMQSPIKEVGKEGYYWAQANKNLQMMAGIVEVASPAYDIVSSYGSGIKGLRADKGGIYGPDSDYLKAMSGVDRGSEALANSDGVGKILDSLKYNFTQGRVNSQQPSVKFSQLYTMQNYFGNAFFEYRMRLSDADMQRFDRYLTMFGYAVNEPLTKECFSGRDYFNFVQAEAVNIKTAGFPLYIRNQIISRIQDGVRLWHVMPTESAFDNNPITVG